MKGTNSTFKPHLMRVLAILLFSFASFMGTMSAQGTCACKGSIQVSVDENCEAEVTTDMVLANATTCGGAGATITIMKTPTSGVIATGVGTVIFPSASLYIGKNVYIKVTEPSGINSCWSTALIEDKLAPTIECPDDLTMSCYELAYFKPTVIENCSHYTLNLVDERVVVNDCNLGLPARVLKTITREYQAVDASGNKSDICSMDITVEGLDSLKSPIISAPVSKIFINDTHLQCDEDYAKIPAGQPFAGNPSPIDIGTKPGCGVPSLLLWDAKPHRGGTINMGATPNSVVITNDNSGNNAKICLVAHKDTIISFNYSVSVGGSFRLSIGDDVNTYTGTGSTGNISVEAGEKICITVLRNNTVVSITNGRTPQPFYLPLYPEVDVYCNIIVTFSDITTQIGCIKKIIRTWKVFEWSCRTTQRSQEFIQMIEIADDEGPTFTAPSDLTVSTTGHGCEGLAILPAIDVKDNCSELTHVDISYPGGILKNKNGGTALLPIGCHLVTYTAYDACYNSSISTIHVTVLDNTAPTVICKQNIVVGLTTSPEDPSGKTWVPATSFDNGSHDECELAKVLVRRMEVAPHSTNCTPCKAPEFKAFTYLGEYGTNKHHYYISKHKASPEVARKTAEAMGGHLVVLDNAAEDKWVYDAVAKWNLDIDYLIGLVDLKRKALWSWINGSTATYRNWASGYPRFVPDPHVPGATNAYPWSYVSREGGKWYDLGSNLCDQSEYYYVVEINDPCGFSEYVGFCCKDVGTPAGHMVVVRAIDKAGNYNDCMVNIEIQDKVAPSIVCPPNMTIHCDDHFDLSNLTKTFGWPTAFDNCETPRITTDSSNTINQCRSGSITRTFTARDRGGRTATCTQHITVLPRDVDTEIVWPEDVDVDTCAQANSASFHPDRIGRPTFNSEICALIGTEYEDEVYTFNDPIGSACFKILRKWTVIDWCKFGPNRDPWGVEYPRNLVEGVNAWYYTQIIKVTDKVKPTITSSCAMKSEATYDHLCKDGYIELLATATDRCTETLFYRYQIDLNNDGSFDSGYSKSGLSNTANASGTYPIGRHRIVWSFEDRCGNLSKCEQIFEIVNEKAPVPYCINGLSTSLMPVDVDNDGDVDDGMIDIWAKDFDRGSSHPCGYPVILSFEPVTRNATTNKLVVKDSLIFRCSKRGNQKVRLYAAVVLPDGRIIQDYCETMIDIQDNNRICSGGQNRIAGSFMTEGEEPVKDVNVTLEGSEMKVTTGNNGLYAFENMSTGGTYVVMPEKNDDPLNGLSTLDLVLIQRHILGLSKLQSPYKLIAADINKDGKITSTDLTELRKLILGVSATFVNNDSWRFVDKTYVFQDPNNAQSEAFPEVNYIPQFDHDMDVNFIAVKVGDVNGNAKANLNNQTEARSASVLSLTTVDQNVVSGQEVIVPVVLAKDASIHGFQYTVNFDTELFDLVEVRGGIQGMTDHNFGFNRLAMGQLATSFHRGEAMNLVAGQPIVELTLRAKKDATLAQGIWIDSSVTSAQAYDSENNLMNIQMDITGRTTETIILHQNTPNPFKGVTVIGFDLPQSMPATLTIYDVTGKVVKSVQGNYAKGYNNVEVSSTELGNFGVLYYTLEAGSFKAIRKMIILE
jgi:hypothetical protein